MNIGIVTVWFERGAAYVSRQFEEILAEKYRVFIYARGGEMYAKGDPNWDHANVTWGKRINSPFVGTVIHKKDFMRWIARNNIEAVLFNEQHWFQPILWCKEMGIKTIAYIDYYNERTIPLFDAYDALICNTKRHSQAFEKHPNAFYIPWGTDTELFVPRNTELVNKYVVTFFHSAGMNGVRKGTDLFIRALSLVRTDHRTIIHTQTDLKAQFPDLSDTIEELENSGKLTVITQTCTAPGLYHLGDVYVYPSRLEGIGLTIAESISCGLACVVTDNPPMNEFVDGSIGDTIPVKRFYSRQDGYYWPQCDCDVTELAELLEKYASDKQLVLTQKKAARQYALEHLSYKKNFRKLFDLFDTIQYAAASESLERQINSFDSYGLKRLQKYYLRYGLYKLRRS